MFEKASRVKLRYGYRGTCTVEDLWDVPLKDLDSIFKVLNVAFKTQKEESLLDKKTKENETLALSIGIVKHVVEVRLREREERESRMARAEKKQKLLAIIAEKQDDDLKGLSVEDLTKLVEDL